MEGIFNVVTALLIIAIILLSSGSRMFIRYRFRKNLQPHLEALERASKKNAEVRVNGAH